MKTNYLSGLLFINLACVSGCYHAFPSMEGNPDQGPSILQLAGQLTVPVQPDCSRASSVWTWNPDTGTLSTDIQSGDPMKQCKSGMPSASLTCSTSLPTFPVQLASASQWELIFQQVWTPSTTNVESRLDSVDVYLTDTQGDRISGISHSSTVLSGQPYFVGLQAGTTSSSSPKDVRMAISTSDVAPANGTGHQAMGRLNVTLHTACTISGGGTPPAPAKLELKNMRLVPITP